jgi:chromosome segregation ATPase
MKTIFKKIKSLFKPIMITIPRQEYNELTKAKEIMASTIFDQCYKIDELKEELECYELTKKLLNLQARTDKHTIKALENSSKEKQDYCDYLELESNKTEQAYKIRYELSMEQKQRIRELNKELKAKDKLVANVRAENDRLGEKLKAYQLINSNNQEAITGYLGKIESLQKQLENSKNWETEFAEFQNSRESKVKELLLQNVFKPNKKDNPQSSISSQITKAIKPVRIKKNNNYENNYTRRK